MNLARKETFGGRGILVYLPPSYAEGESRYPVLYVHDGGYLFEDCANWLQHLIAIGSIPEVIYIGIETDNRNDEYTPWPAKALMEGRPDFGGKSPEYIAFLADRLKPYIDNRYRTLRAPEHTGIIGASFGGLVSMHAAYLRPDVFGAVGSLSGSYWYEGYLDYMREQPQPPPVRKLFMSVGDCEGIYKHNIQKLMVPNTIKARDLLLEQGFPAQGLKFVIDEGATHDSVFFIKQFPKAIRWFFT
jgi:predicted alpha/beta superfamily hydrolase